MKTGVQRIAAERQRQIDVEGWTPEHDDEHDEGQMADAAACYAATDRIWMDTKLPSRISFIDPWPWSADWDKRPREMVRHVDINHHVTHSPGEFLCAYDAPVEERIRALEKAGALVAAEIDRLVRTQDSTT